MEKTTTRMTMLEVLDTHRGLPALVQRLLQLGEVQRALDLGTTIRKLKPEVEVFELNHRALIAAYGEMDRETRQKEIVAGTENLEKYEEAFRALLARGIKLNVKPIMVSAEEIQLLDRDSVSAISALVRLEGPGKIEPIGGPVKEPVEETPEESDAIP